MFGLTTTSPQCFGTLPDAPEADRVGGDVRWVDATGVVPSVLGVGAGDAAMGVWRVAWGWRCGCGWRDQISMTELRVLSVRVRPYVMIEPCSSRGALNCPMGCTYSDVRWQMDSSASLSRLTYSESG